MRRNIRTLRINNFLTRGDMGGRLEFPLQVTAGSMADHATQEVGHTWDGDATNARYLCSHRSLKEIKR